MHVFVWFQNQKLKYQPFFLRTRFSWSFVCVSDVCMYVYIYVCMYVMVNTAGLMLGWLGAVHLILRFLLPWPLALSATLGYASAGLWYEFLHFIVHTRVRFRSNSYLHTMKAHHQRHHLVDNTNWFAFSVPTIDTLFGTNPTPHRHRRRR